MATKDRVVTQQHTRRNEMKKMLLATLLLLVSALPGEAIVCQYFAPERYRCPAPDGPVFSPTQADVEFGVGNWSIVGAPTPPPSPPPTPPSGGVAAPVGLVDVTIALAMGDSNTAGGYPTILKFYRNGVSVIDSGSAGAGMDALRAGVPQALSTGAQAISLQGGVNDLARGRSVADILGDVQSIGTQIVNANRTFILIGMLPPNDDPAVSLANALSLNQGMRALAAQFGWRYVEIWHHFAISPSSGTLRAEYMQAPGNVHLSNRGHRRMAELLAIVGYNW